MPYCPVRRPKSCSLLYQSYPVELQKVLCTACSIAEELAANSTLESSNIQRLLRASCQMYLSEQREGCQISRFFSLDIEDRVLD